MADPDSLAKGPDLPEPAPQAEGQPIDPPEEAGAIGTAGAAGGGGGGALGGGEAAGGGGGGAPLGGGGTGGGGGASLGAGESAAIFTGGRPVGGIATLFNIGGAPVSAGTSFVPTASVEQAGTASAGAPVGGPSSIFNIGGAPIAILGGVFSGGLPLGGPVTQIFRGGSGPQPNTLFLSTITPGGPIGNFLIGLSGAPIGVNTFSGGGLAIGPPQFVSEVVASIGSRTAGVTGPSLAFGSDIAPPPGGAIGTTIGG